MPIRRTGIVKFFNHEKGYGFIIPDGGTKDIFVHQSDVVKSGLTILTQKERVEFEVAEVQKGPKAVNIAYLSDFQGEEE